MMFNNSIFLFLIIVFLGIYIFFKGLNKFSYNFNKSNLDKLFYKLNNLYPYTLICIGFITSSIIQSTSVCITLLIPLVNNNKINLKNSFYLIIGLNIGTVTSLFLSTFSYIIWIIILIIISLILYFCYKTLNKSYIIYILYSVIGIILIFTGLLMLKLSFKILYSTKEFKNIIKNIIHSDIKTFITGIILSAIIQSGSIINNSFQELYLLSAIELDKIILIIIGTNLGSTITGILASIKFNLNAKTLAYFHIILNLIGSLIILTFFNNFKLLITTITNNKQYHISYIHLLFNSLSGFLLIPFINKIYISLSNQKKKGTF